MNTKTQTALGIGLMIIGTAGGMTAAAPAVVSTRCRIMGRLDIGGAKLDFKIQAHGRPSVGPADAGVLACP